MSEPSVGRFDEIEVKRLRVVDSRGTPRISLSNKPLHDALFRGEAVGGGQRNSAGFIFFTEEGTECSGLCVHGTKQREKVSAGATLTMDAYEQDQVVTFAYSQSGATGTYGLTLQERPHTSMKELIDATRGWRKWPFILKLVASRRLRTRMKQEHATRLRLGRVRSGDVGMFMSDSKGKERIRLVVDADDNPRMEFLDESGRVTYQLPPVD